MIGIEGRQNPFERSLGDKQRKSKKIIFSWQEKGEDKKWGEESKNTEDEHMLGKARSLQEVSHLSKITLNA